MLYNQDWEQPKVNPVSDVLLKAADLLEKHGHTKGTRKDDTGSMCLLGAIEEAQGRETGVIFHKDSELTGKAAQAIVEVMGLKIPEHVLAYVNMDYIHERHAAAVWNNKTERTGQEVIDAMRLTAKMVAKTLVAA